MGDRIRNLFWDIITRGKYASTQEETLFKALAGKDIALATAALKNGASFNITPRKHTGGVEMKYQNLGEAIVCWLNYYRERDQHPYIKRIDSATPNSEMREFFLAQIDRSDKKQIQQIRTALKADPILQKTLLNHCNIL